MDSTTRKIVQEEFRFTASRSSGPGGQNVNKVNSKVTLRWNLLRTALEPSLKLRLKKVLEKRITKSGEIICSVDASRDQKRNKEACLRKVFALIDEGLRIPKRRRRTAPKASKNEERLRQKKARARLKVYRAKAIPD